MCIFSLARRFFLEFILTQALGKIKIIFIIRSKIVEIQGTWIKFLDITSFSGKKIPKKDVNNFI